MWFDVGIKRYTTDNMLALHRSQLWFDVGIKRYTTNCQQDRSDQKLWFDVGIKRYTTQRVGDYRHKCCGLM